MPRNWNDDDTYNEDDAGSQGSPVRSRSPVGNRDSGVITGTRARDICNDADTINARICVMDLNQTIDKEMIEEYFLQFGKVVAIFILRNKRNAFVQYEDEDDARECLSAGESATIGDVDATVKPAKQGGDSTKPQQQQQQQQQQKNNNQQQNKGNKNNKGGGKKKILDFNDPSSADSRVFVDPVNGAITKGDIEDEMAQFGHVLGVQIQSRKDKNMPRYAFVQFDDVVSARECIRKKNMSVKGFNLMVRSVTSSNNKNDDVPQRKDNRNAGKNVNRNAPAFRGQESKTTDPSTANARVYIGNIQGDIITREDLRDCFSNFGVVTSVSLHKKKDNKKGFAFVQFQDEEGAQNCLLVGKTIFIRGQQLDIGPVKSEQMSGNDGGSSSNISPWDMQRPYSNESNRYSIGNDYMPMSTQSFGHTPLGGMGQMSSMSSMSLSHNASSSMNSLNPDRPNDAEIVVASLAQRSYAEYIESQLLSLNMKVDLIFPPAGLSTSKIITDLIKRKCLFAIMITQENEMRRSLTLHVLQGAMQAHCNIPIANAMKLIEENFMEYAHTMRQQMMGGPLRGMQQPSMGQGMYGSSSFGQGNHNSGNSSLFGSPPSNFRGDARGMLGMAGGGGGGSGGNTNNGLLGPVPNDVGSSLMGPVPPMSGGSSGGGEPDVGNMYSLVLDSVKMARELRNVRGEVDVKEIMAGREFQERVAALKAKANAVKQNMMMEGGGGGGQTRQNFF